MPGVKLTPIKPRVLPFQASKVSAAITAATKKAAAELVKDFEKTAAGWNHKPRWIVRVGRDGVEVRTDDRIWKMVDQGTRPHVIRPRRATLLRFASGYSAKTRPGSIISRGGGPSGDVVWAKEVQHPGTKARGFSRRLRAKWAKKFSKDMQAAINEAVR